jgi:hypothetical protein
VQRPERESRRQKRKSPSHTGRRPCKRTVKVPVAVLFDESVAVHVTCSKRGRHG